MEMTGAGAVINQHGTQTEIKHLHKKHAMLQKKIFMLQTFLTNFEC
jgi:hypothetical protein